MLELKNENLTVQFSELGGQIISIKDKDGIEYLWQGDPTYWSGQAPVLFPICGSLRNDWAIYEPAERPTFTGTIPRHGLVRKMLFKNVKSTENSLEFSISSNEETVKNYPFEFELSINYSLLGNTIRTEYRVKNLEGHRKLPYFIGGHPGFNCPLLDGESYEDYYLEFEKVESCTVPKSFPETGLLDLRDRRPFLEKQKTLDLSYKLFEHDAITLDQLASRKVTLKSKNHQKKLSIAFDDFPYLVIWSTTNQSPFIALEPWSGLSTSLEESDIFNAKRNISYVAPKEVDKKHFDIIIE
ncbi:aldose 1-epimerase family protein [Streptococcus suis]|nr:aldose 1-epimerase family protein [Streptococcus suis]